MWFHCKLRYVRASSPAKSPLSIDVMLFQYIGSQYKLRDIREEYPIKVFDAMDVIHMSIGISQLVSHVEQ
jgi:hypothetical protein